MNQEVIGTNAGLIWNALCEPKSLSLKALKKATKLKDKELYLALGWLAREGKISFDESTEELFIVLL
ncbi:MAG: winged helix-turn-helix domain-containing protein [Bacteroidales bacterium]|nr:winged helix-turn-helix domain-containing protein [Bacteroidales bacterium]